MTKPGWQIEVSPQVSSGGVYPRLGGLGAKFISRSSNNVVARFILATQDGDRSGGDKPRPYDAG